ncbi:MAG TPA: right-handed parallel beta-helix repeat-containing protein, partial [Eoetvoesiella sp.]
ELDNLHIHHYCSDGAYIGSYSGVISRHVNAKNCQFANNGRQGVSIIQLRYATFTNCDFRETGRTGLYGGHSPRAGVDIEPNVGVPKVDDYTGDIKFENCRFADNQGFQYVGTSYEKTPYPVTFVSCVFKETLGKSRNRVCDVLPATKLTRFEACRFENTPLFPSYSINKKANTTEVVRCTFVSDQADQQMLGCLAPAAINVVADCEFIFNAPKPASKANYRRIHINNSYTRFLNNRIFISKTEHRGDGSTLVALIYNAEAATGNTWTTDLAAPGQYFKNAYADVGTVSDSFPNPKVFRRT